MTGVESLYRAIRDVPDFPKPGIVFKDITPLLLDPQAFRAATDLMAALYRKTGVTRVVAIESRGFLLGAPVAHHLSAGLVPIRKPGKLPGERGRVEYDLEYGTDALEIHLDAVRPGARVLMIDDLLATGGTMVASCDLVRSLGGEIAGVAFLIELCALRGRERLAKYPVHSVIQIDANGRRVTTDF